MSEGSKVLKEETVAEPIRRGKSRKVDVSKKRAWM
jgi:hypothetical protein